jgi:hypothetical protein
LGKYKKAEILGLTYSWGNFDWIQDCSILCGYEGAPASLGQSQLIAVGAASKSSWHGWGLNLPTAFDIYGINSLVLGYVVAQSLGVTTRIGKTVIEFIGGCVNEIHDSTLTESATDIIIGMVAAGTINFLFQNMVRPFQHIGVLFSQTKLTDK